MAYLFRIALFLLVCIGTNAHAEIPKTFTYQGYSAGSGSTCAAAAAAQLANYALSNPLNSYSLAGSCNSFDSDGYTVIPYTEIVKSTGVVSFGNMLVQRRGGVCPANSVEATPSTCACSSGFTESGNTCVAPGTGGCLIGMERDTFGVCVCKAGTRDNGFGGCVANDGAAKTFCEGMSQVKAPLKLAGSSVGSTPTTSCYMPFPPFEGADADKGCVTTVGDSVAIPGPNGTRQWSATGISTGATCTDAPTLGDGTTGQDPPPKAVTNPCPSGFPGTVNGVTVCAPSVPDSGIEGTKTTETKSPDGNTTTEHETTKCNAGVCTTTKNTVVKNAAGETISSTPGNTVTQPVGAMCAKDPGNKVCSSVGLGGSSGGGGTGGNGTGTGEGSSFGGDCAAGFKAKSEDAVVNAMAEETFRQNCKVNPDADSQTVGKAANIADPAESIKKGNAAFSEITISKDDISSVDSIGQGEQCMPDKSISIHGQSFLIPFSTICDPMRYIGLIAVAASFLIAFRIIGGKR